MGNLSTTFASIRRYSESTRIASRRAYLTRATSSSSAALAHSTYHPQSTTYGTRSTDSAANAAQVNAFRDWVYAAVRPIANRIAAQPIRMGTKKRTPYLAGVRGGSGFRKSTTKTLNQSPFLKSAILEDDVDPVENHNLLDIFAAPSDEISATQLLYLTTCWLQLSGQGYWWFASDVDQFGNPRPKIYPFPPNWVTAVYIESTAPNGTTTKTLDHWKVRPPGAVDGTPIPADEMIRFFVPDPAWPTRAKSPLQSIARAIGIDDAILTAQRAAFDNGIHPSVVLKAGRMKDANGRDTGQRPIMTPQQRIDLINAAKMIYAGALNFGEPFIVDGLIEDIVKFSHSPSEMDFSESTEVIKQRIFQGFGVNPIVAGQTENANRASSYVADFHFCANVVNPMISLISETLTAFFNRHRDYMDPANRLLVYIEPCEPFDADLRLKEMDMLAKHGVLKVNEMRQAYQWEQLSEDEGGEEFVGGGREGGDGSGGAGGGMGDGEDDEDESGEGEDESGDGDGEGDSQGGSSSTSNQNNNRNRNRTRPNLAGDGGESGPSRRRGRGQGKKRRRTERRKVRQELSTNKTTPTP